MNALVVHKAAIPAMTDEAIAKVYALEEELAQLPQEVFETHHVLHGGMYARTVLLKAGVTATGALIQVPTVLIVCGHATVYIDGEPHELQGYHVLPAAGHRKQAVYAHVDTLVTMMFASKATTVEQAEAEFTHEHERLASRHGVNTVIITGE